MIMSSLETGLILSELELLDGSVPIIDMDGLHGPNRSRIVKQIGQACQYFGFFLVKNHGISETKINNIQATAREFFKLPEEERSKFSATDPPKSITLHAGVKNKTENIFVSRESLRFYCHPIQNYIDEWPSNPPSFSKNVIEYTESVRRVELTLLEAISESLDMERNGIYRMLTDKHGHYIAMNYYPICPEEDLQSTRGLGPHTDPSIITILLQDNVVGLEVLSNDGTWVEINPVPNTFVINVGDLLQAISNSRYKSLVHRTFVNTVKERISVATYCYPSSDSSIEVAKELIDSDHPAMYKNFTYGEFFAQMSRSRCANAGRLDSFMLSTV